jgi:hypothetical protein
MIFSRLRQGADCDTVAAVRHNRSPIVFAHPRRGADTE